MHLSKSVFAEFIQEMTSRGPRLQPINVVVVRHVSGTCWSASGAVWRPPSVGVGWPPRRCVWSSWSWVVGWRATCAAGRRLVDTVLPTLPPRRRQRTGDRGGHRTMLAGSTRRVSAAALNDLHNCTNSNHAISVCDTKGSKYTVYQKKCRNIFVISSRTFADSGKINFVHSILNKFAMTKKVLVYFFWETILTITNTIIIITIIINIIYFANTKYTMNGVIQLTLVNTARLVKGSYR